ncbi:unnamed protein product [Lampetra fluviatilis]
MTKPRDDHFAGRPAARPRQEPCRLGQDARREREARDSRGRRPPWHGLARAATKLWCRAEVDRGTCNAGSCAGREASRDAFSLRPDRHGAACRVTVAHVHPAHRDPDAAGLVPGGAFDGKKGNSSLGFVPRPSEAKSLDPYVDVRGGSTRGAVHER